MQLEVNTELQGGKYRIVRVLGQGGFGITYLAEHTMLDKMVAIKEFFPKEYCDRDESSSRLTIGTRNSAEIVEMLKAKFIKEAKNISKLRHHNIITIHDIFQENDTAYYVMEYVDGDSLSQMIKQQGALSEACAIEYIRKVADAVGYMHSLSMNHLDLKPANIMVRAADNEPILIDFGLSKQYDASGGQTSTTPMGISHGFAPIEQYRPGGVATFTPQTDIYALGATLFNLLSGTVPPHYSEILEDGLPVLPESVSQLTVNAIEHAMAINKNKRPSSVSEFLGEVGTLPNNPIKEENTPITSPQMKSESTIEETVLMGDHTQAKDISLIDNSITIDGFEFVDLGLSVKWANKNLGAEDVEDSGKFFSKKMGDDLNELFQWNTQGAVVPSIEHFQELLTHCRWVWSGIGYTIIGLNGKSIFLPCPFVKNHEWFGSSAYSVYWTNEALLNEFRSKSHILFIDKSLHILAEKPLAELGCPIRLIYHK